MCLGSEPAWVETQWCPACGGDRGWDVPHDIDRRNGGTIDHWVGCGFCGGTGAVEAQLAASIFDLEDRCGDYAAARRLPE